MKKLFLILFLIPNFVFGNCNKDVTYLKQNDTAPCEGYLFTPKKEQEIRLKITNYDNLMQIVEKQDELTKVLAERLDVCQKMNDGLKSELNNEKDIVNLERIVYLGLGIILGASVNQALR